MAKHKSTTPVLAKEASSCLTRRVVTRVDPTAIHLDDFTKIDLTGEQIEKLNKTYEGIPDAIMKQMEDEAAQNAKDFETTQREAIQGIKQRNAENSQEVKRQNDICATIIDEEDVKGN